MAQFFPGACGARKWTLPFVRWACPHIACFPNVACFRSFRSFREIQFVDAQLVLLPGDGIGPEVVAQAERVLKVISEKFGHHFQSRRMPMGGQAIDSLGDPAPEETLAACRCADAILLVAVRRPNWDDP